MGRRMSVRVVDDDGPMTKTKADVLRFKGFQAHPAHSGSEALAILRETDIDLVMTDVRMPDMNGVELYRAIQEIQPRLPTLLMTAHADQPIRVGACRNPSLVFMDKEGRPGDRRARSGSGPGGLADLLQPV